MEHSVKIPVVDQKRPQLQKILRTVFIISLFLFFVLVIFIDNNVIFIMLILISFSSLLLITFSKRFTIRGFLFFDSQKIIFKNEESEIKFLLNKIQSIHLKYYGYKGKYDLLNPKSVVPDDGSGNYLSINYPEHSKKYELLLTKSHLNSLKEIIHQWKTNDISFELTGSLD